jgi:glyoxylase-like metal-dependent hydrolase (beta-lactamase superfamily II)/8-oxo-dGTP pyrophosphatase MutT (NUDIX family)
MSATFPTLPPPPLPTDPIPATAVILHRDGPEGREVVLVRRGKDLRFAGGWHAFPGGRVDPTDRDVAVPGLTREAAALVACGVRELFEETGVLLLRGADRVMPPARDAARRALLEGTLTLPALLARHGLAIDASALVPAGRWITPEHLPLRYDAQLFLAALPPGEAPEIWPGELADGGLVPASRALEGWARGERLLHPPNLNALRVLARNGPVDLAALRDPPHRDGFVSRRMEFQGGFFLAALRTPTIPPAAHTNAWLVPGERGLALVDPGSPYPEEQARLFALLDALAAEGRPLEAVWLTHAHPDHVGGVAAVAERYRVPVRAHPAAAPGVDVAIGPLAEGERLGRFRVLETPGHAREHLAFLDEETGALLCGDMASTLSTIVIDPPEGDMAEYERQLERLAALLPRTLYPAHGPPAPDAAARLLALREHRRLREEKIRAALATPGTLAEVTARAYDDTPAELLPIASRSCLAALLKLAALGRASERAGVWAAA